MFSQLDTTQSLSYRMRFLLLQILIAGFLPFVYTEILSDVFGISEANTSGVDSIIMQLVTPAAIIIFGMAIGYFLALLIFNNTSSSKYVWILPLCFLLAAVSWDLLTFSFDWHEIWTSYFVWQQSGGRVGILLRDFISYPALSSVAYSVGAALSNRQLLRRAVQH